MPSRRIEGPEASLYLKRAAQRAEEIKLELRSEIKKRGLSERELADELGFGPTYLTNLFVASPGRTPTALKLETLLALLEMLEVDLVEFFGRVERRGKRQKAAAGQKNRISHPVGRKDYELFRELLGAGSGNEPDQVVSLARRAIEFVKRHSGSPPRGRGKR